MVWAVLVLIPSAFALSLAATWVVRSISRRAGAFDTPGVPGQVKAPRRRVPNTGGVGIVTGIVGTLALGLAAAWLMPGGNADGLPDAVRTHAPGLREQTPGAIWLLAGVLALHALGLVDDRRPLGPWSKLAIMAGVAGAVLAATDTRLLTLLDPLGGGAGVWVSWGVTLLWVLVVTNAMNFLDNMDGLSAGVGAIAAASLLACALIRPDPQWFVAAALAVLLGSLGGFLVFNRPPATIFMGDGGSLVLGFLLAFLSIRITYATLGPIEGDAGQVGSPETAPHAPWFTLLTPLVILAIPLYDFVTVVVLRLRQGRSPFVGDLQHFSHRLVDRGLTPSRAVAVVAGFAAVAGLAGVALTMAGPTAAVLLGLQILLLLGIVAMLEFGAPPPGPDGATPP